MRLPVLAGGRGPSSPVDPEARPVMQRSMPLRVRELWSILLTKQKFMQRKPPRRAGLTRRGRLVRNPAFVPRDSPRAKPSQVRWRRSFFDRISDRFHYVSELTRPRRPQQRFRALEPYLEGSDCSVSGVPHRPGEGVLRYFPSLPQQFVFRYGSMWLFARYRATTNR